MSCMLTWAIAFSAVLPPAAVTQQTEQYLWLCLCVVMLIILFSAVLPAIAISGDQYVASLTSHVATVIIVLFAVLSAIAISGD